MDECMYPREVIIVEEPKQEPQADEEMDLFDALVQEADSLDMGTDGPTDCKP